MADNEEAGAEDKAAAAPKSKKKLFIIIGAALALIGGGAGGYFAFFKHSAPDEHHAEAAKPKPPVFLDMPEVMVNLANGPGERVQYLKMKIVLEVKDQPQVAAITPALPRVMDIFQTYLRELRPTDLSGSAGIYRLKEELSRRVNAVVSPSEINAVLFKEIVIQ